MIQKEKSTRTQSDKARGKTIWLLSVLLLLALLALSFAGCTGSENLETTSSVELSSNNISSESDDNQPTITVIASFYPMYDFAARIGGTRIELINMVPSGVEPHSWEPSAGDIVKLEQADVFVYNGAGMEHWVDTILSAVSSEDLVIVETAADLELRDGHDHDHDMDHIAVDDHDEETHVNEETDHDNDDGHDHGDQDPHVWLDPLLAIDQMRAIRDAFITADPDGSDYYNDNYAMAKAEFEELDSEFHRRLEKLASRDLIVAHEAYGYLAAAYDLDQIAISGLSPEDEPSPARMAEIIDLAEQRQIGVIFFEELVSPKVAQTIADAVGAETAVLSTLEGLTNEQSSNGDDYISVMRQNLETIEHHLGLGE